MAMLTISGIDAKESSKDGIQLDLVSGFVEPYDVRGTDTIIPDLGGRITRNRIRDTRRVLFEGYITGTSAADWLSNTQSLFGAMDPELGPFEVVIADGYLGTSTTYTLSDCLFVNAVGGPPLYAVKYQTWSIEIVSNTPFWSPS